MQDEEANLVNESGFVSYNCRDCGREFRPFRLDLTAAIVAADLGRCEGKGLVRALPVDIGHGQNISESAKDTRLRNRRTSGVAQEFASFRPVSRADGSRAYPLMSVVGRAELRAMSYHTHDATLHPTVQQEFTD
jgi:hypothetical protein